MSHIFINRKTTAQRGRVTCPCYAASTWQSCRANPDQLDPNDHAQCFGNNRHALTTVSVMMMTVMIRWQWSWWQVTGWVTSCAAGAVLGVLYALTHLILSMPLYRWENIGSEKSGHFNQVDTASDSGAGIQTSWSESGACAVNHCTVFPSGRRSTLCLRNVHPACAVFPPAPLAADPFCWCTRSRCLLSLSKPSSVSSVKTAPVPGFSCICQCCHHNHSWNLCPLCPTQPVHPPEAEVVVSLEPTAPHLPSSGIPFLPA